MKKIILSFLFLTLVLTAFKSIDLNKMDAADEIDLSSKLTIQPTVVVQSGCNAFTPATIKINNPENNNSDIKFALSFTCEQKQLIYTIENTTSLTIENCNAKKCITIKKGSSLLIGIKLQMSNKDFDFNKGLVVNAAIYFPDRSFLDGNHSNDSLTQTIIIGSPNVLCNKCIITENFLANIDYGIFVPNISSYIKLGCNGKMLYYLNANTESGELTKPLSRFEIENAFFKIIDAGVFPNTTVKRYLIKNKAGNYLTYENGVPKFVPVIQNDNNNYQKWTLLKENANKCGDKLYSLVQYIDSNMCKTLMLTRRNNKLFLVYKNGVISEPYNEFEKILISPRYNNNNNNGTN